MIPEKLSPQRFSELVVKCWDAETCWEEMRDTWRAENPAHGQCLITCALAQKFVKAEESEAGGWIVRPAYAITPDIQAANQNWKDTPEAGILHFYLQVIDGPDFDPTFSQFAKGTQLVRADETVDPAVFLDESFKTRYQLLEDRFVALMNNTSDTDAEQATLPDDPVTDVSVPPEIMPPVAPGMLPPDLAEKLAAEEKAAAEKAEQEEDELKKKLEEPEPTPP
jgi:hypothetical protein